jgi:hypothetical protein
MPPRWFQLLRAQQSRGRYALTIPFIIGSLRSASDPGETSVETVRQEIFDLLNSFLEDAPSDYAVRLSRCPDIHQPVVAQFYSLYASTNGLKSLSQGRPTLFADPEFAPDGQFSIATLTEKLFRELHPAICAGHFSFRAGEYVPFTADDRDFLDASIV